MPLTITLSTDPEDYTTDPEATTSGDWRPRHLIYEGDINGDGDVDLFYVPMEVKDSKITKLKLEDVEVKLSGNFCQESVTVTNPFTIDEWHALVKVDGQTMKVPKTLEAYTETLGMTCPNKTTK